MVVCGEGEEGLLAMGSGSYEKPAEQTRACIDKRIRSRNASGRLRAHGIAQVLREYGIPQVVRQHRHLPGLLVIL